MPSGLEQIINDGNELRLDAYNVVRNFFGEHDWKWLKDENDGDEAKEVIRSRYQRFKDEMMEGTRFYTNRSKFEDRFILGLAATLYAATLYAPSRLVYDGILNSIEFISWRMMGQAIQPWHPQGRKTNAYILGIPVSIPFVVATSVIETGFRLTGLSTYGKDIVKAAAIKTLNMSWYTKEFFCEIPKENENAVVQRLLTPPKNVCDVLDRFGYASLPGVLSCALLTIGAGITLIGGVGETMIRTLGISKFGGNIIKTAAIEMSRMSNYTEAIVGYHSKEELIELRKQLIEWPKTFWDKVDRLSFFTLPGGIALVEMLLGAGITITGLTTENLLRISGVSEQGLAIIKVSYMIAARTSKYAKFLGDYTIEQIQSQINILNLPIHNYQDVLNRAAYITIPGAIALFQMTAGIGLSVSGYVGETIARLLGFNHHAMKFIKLGYMVMARTSSYSEALFGKFLSTDIAKIKAELNVPWQDGWDFIDRCSLVTIPAAIVLSEVTLGAMITAIASFLESTSRVLGASEYGLTIIKTAGLIGISMSRYTNPFGYDLTLSIHDAKRILFARPQTVSDYLDRIGFLTIPGAIAVSELLIAAAISLTGCITEVSLRVSGVSHYGMNVIKAGYCLMAGNSKYTEMLFGQVSNQEILESFNRLKAPINSVWDLADRFGLVTIPGAIAVSEAIIGLGVTLSAGATEIAMRLLGISEFGKNYILAAYKHSAVLSFYSSKIMGHFSEQDIRQHDHHFNSPITTGWDVCDSVSQFTIPGLIATSLLSLSVTTTLVGGLGEGIARVLGLNTYAWNAVRLGYYYNANLNKYSSFIMGDFSKENVNSHVQNVVSLPVTFRDVCDRISLVTIPGIILVAQTTLALSSSVVGGALETLFRASGVSNYGWSIIEAGYRTMANCSEYTSQLFGKFTHQQLMDSRNWLREPIQSGWDLIDRIGLITLPGIIALSEVFAGLGITVLAGTSDYLARTLGISQYGKHIIMAAYKRSASLSLYTETLLGKFSPESLAANEEVLWHPINSTSDAIDRIGLITFPGLIAALEIGIGASLTVIAGITEGVVRCVGGSNYGIKLIDFAVLSAFTMSRYTNPLQLNFDKELSDAKKILFSHPVSIRDYCDRVSYLTIPGVIGVVSLSLATIVSLIGNAIEAICRMAGISTYGANIIAASFKRAARLSIYTEFLFGKYTHEDIASHESILKRPIKSLWNVIDYAGFITAPGIIALSNVTLSALITLIGGSIEGVARVAGLNQFSYHLMIAAFKLSARISRYTHFFLSPFSDLSMEDNVKVITAPIKSFRDVCDRLSMFTLPGVLSLSQLAVGCGITLIGGLFETTLRVLGFQTYGWTIVKSSFMRMTQISCYTEGLFGVYPTAFITECEALLKMSPKNTWEILDRFSLLTLPGAIAITQLIIGLGITTVAGATEIVGRVIGLTNYGKQVYQSLSMRSSNLSLHTQMLFGQHSKEEIAVCDANIFADPQTWRDFFDRGALFTLPIMLGLFKFMSAAGISISGCAIEVVLRSFGVSERAWSACNLISSLLGNMLGLQTHANFEENKQRVKAPINDWREAVDMVGVGVSSAMVSTLGFGVVAPLSLLGINFSNYHRIHYLYHQLHNDLQVRRSQPVLRETEKYHLAALTVCESSYLGKTFSQLNVINLSREGSYLALRYVAGPTIYGACRLLKHGLGIVPLAKALADVANPTNYDLTDAIDIIKKRFSELVLILNHYGNFPKGVIRDKQIDEKRLEIEVLKAKRQSVCHKFTYGLFSEARKIFSLGHSIEERVIGEFSDRFNDFIAVNDRLKLQSKPQMSVNRFFTKDIPMLDGDRFSFDNMVEHIKRTYVDQTSKEKVQQIAESVRTAINGIMPGDNHGQVEFKH